MEKLRFVGMDVHAEATVLAVADDDGSQPMVVGSVPTDPRKVLKRLRELGRNVSLRCCYEAGPTGFGLARDLNRAGIECEVVAPSRVPDGKGNRMKTDSGDAVRLARFLRSGDLVPIHIPDDQTEAMRDLSRAREAALRAKQVARQHLSGMALRYGRRYPGARQGTKAHLEWLKAQAFEHESQRRAWADYILAYEAALDREAKLIKDIDEMTGQWNLSPVVQALMSLRAVSLITAVTVVAEVGDFARFARAPHFASFLGLTASERSSGDRRIQGGITRHGNSRVRRVLVEAAWNYRFRSLSKAIRKRGELAPPEVRLIAQRAQDRLYRRYRHLMLRGKEKNKVAVAVARELACFMWAIAIHPSVRLQARAPSACAA